MTSIAKEPYNCLILQGGPDPCPLPPSLPSNYRELTCFWSLMSQHIRLWIHFVPFAFTSTKDTASPFIFKRIFVSMPIHLLVLFLLFIMSNLFYRGSGFQFVAKKNYMGRFIFFMERGSICLNAQLPQRLHLILWQLLFRLNKYDFSNNMS